MASNATRFGSLIAGGIVAGSLLSQFTGYVFVRGGPSVLNPADATVDALCYGSGCYLAYKECETGVSRTGCTVTASGGKATSATCLIANPYDGTTLPSTSSGSLWRVELDVYANPTATAWSIGPTKASTASGHAIARGVTAGTGSRVVRTLSGVNVDASFIHTSGYIGFWASNPITSSTRYKCRAWLNDVDRN